MMTEKAIYYEDFTVGDLYIHHQGRTVTEADNHMFTLLVMNTAELHFNQDMVERDPEVSFGGRRVVYGGIVLSIVVGLTSDFGESILIDIGYDNGRHTAPVFHGDTLYAESEVLSKRDADRPDAGIVQFKLVGKNQQGTVVLEIEREVLIKKHPSKE
ncbi:MAG: MaoC family dehydratase [Candidatus Tectomicrobia bacterium]|nr:MaoC family dehydratase [Candidatus Tectomicrobia bacterium]